VRRRLSHSGIWLGESLVLTDAEDDRGELAAGVRDDVRFRVFVVAAEGLETFFDVPGVEVEGLFGGR
jgi:hypothetical protein